MPLVAILNYVTKLSKYVIRIYYIPSFKIVLFARDFILIESQSTFSNETTLVYRRIFYFFTSKTYCKSCIKIWKNIVSRLMRLIAQSCSK